jgi:hypothetical protein
MAFDDLDVIECVSQARLRRVHDIALIDAALGATLQDRKIFPDQGISRTRVGDEVDDLPAGRP